MNVRYTYRIVLEVNACAVATETSLHASNGELGSGEKEGGVGEWHTREESERVGKAVRWTHKATRKRKAEDVSEEGGKMGSAVDKQVISCSKESH